MLKMIGPFGSMLIVVGFLASTVFAQGGNAVINGTVFDQAKSVLPGVTITVTNEATGISREAVSGPEGHFVVPTLLPGTYTIQTTLAGFQGQRREGIVVRIGQELTIDLTMSVAGVAEQIVVSAQAPIIETTASRIGAVVSDQEIDSLPSQGRNHLSLMQLVPGLVPALTPGEFEGGNFNTNGRTTASNLWTVDGAANQDTDGGGTGPQARITLDSMAEFQVLTHQYTAEFGGSSGVIVNAVTKSGSNLFSGRGFYYFEDESLRARDPFLDPSEPKPEAGRKTFGFNVGGPIVRNKAFFFFNVERNLIENAVVHTMPPEAAPLAVSYADATFIKALSTFARVDYTAGNNNLSFRWQREVSPAVGEDFECCQTLDNRQIELDSNDRMINVGWTSIIGNRMTNEMKFSHVGEDRVDGNLAYMGDPCGELEHVGLDRRPRVRRTQWPRPVRHRVEECARGLRRGSGGGAWRRRQPELHLPGHAHLRDWWRRTHVQDRLPVEPSHGQATAHRRERQRDVHLPPQLSVRPANARTYPSRFTIVMGNTLVDSQDDWWNGFIQDQWRLTPNLTLNLGLRYDYQELTPETQAFAPRLGFAYDPFGSGKTIVRGGAGKFYEYHLVGVAINLERRGVYSQVFTFDTGEDRGADTGIIPTNACLQPSGSGGLAVISPACRAMLTGIRNSLQPGASTQFVNTEPQLDGDRGMGYLWGYSLGVKHELMPNLAVGVDYVGNRGHDQTAQIDINEGPVGANGRITRLGPARVRSDRRADSPGCPERELPTCAAVPDPRRSEQRLRLDRALTREALLGSLERPRRVHARLQQ